MAKTRIVFDLDDTLYPERDFAHSGFRAAGAMAQEAWGVEGLAGDMIRMLDEGHLGGIFKECLKPHLPDHTTDHVARLIETYRDHEPEIELFDDGAWALDHYSAKGPLGLITDGTHSVQASKVAALGIAPRFAHIVYTHALGGKSFAKPHPEAYEIMAAQIGAPGDQFVYVGDNPKKDFVTPNAHGWISVQVLRDKTIHDQSAVVEGGAPQHQIRSLRELPDILGI